MNRCYYLYCLLICFVLMVSCKSNVSKHDWHAFVKHTDVEEAGLKGKVKSVVTYHCALDSVEHCKDIDIQKYDSRGFLTESIDTTGRYFSSDKLFYNNDGLLAKHVYSASAPFPPSVDTYLYSFNEGKRICITHNPDSVSGRVDTSVHLYDKNGNETEYKSSYTKEHNEYDEHGFLSLSRITIDNGNTFEVRRVNDDKGRILKQTWSDGRGSQINVYNKDGNKIQETHLDSAGRKLSDLFIGYCEFDKNGNFLKKISFCPQTKDMWMDRRVIEYY